MMTKGDYWPKNVYFALTLTLLGRLLYFAATVVYPNFELAKVVLFLRVEGRALYHKKACNLNFTLVLEAKPEDDVVCSFPLES